MRSIPVAVLAALAACSSHPAHAPPLRSVPSSIDFGTVAVGSTTPRTVNITYGGPVSASLSVDPGSVPPAVTVEAGSAPLAPGKATAITVVFAPTAPGPLAGTLVLHAGSSSATIELAGTAVIPEVALDTSGTLRFGLVNIGTDRTLSVQIENPSPLAETVLISIDGDPIFRPGLDQVDIAPGSSAGLNITFTPVGRVLYTGTLLIKTCEGCPTGAGLTLTGQGIVEGMMVTPSPLDFGAQLTGVTTCQDVSIENTGDVPLALRSVEPDAAFKASRVFELQLGNLLDGGSSIAPGAKAGIKLCFTPQVVGTTYVGKINFTSTSNLFASLSVQGRGAGSSIVCVPDPLDFGITTAVAPNVASVVCTNLGEPMDLLLRSVTAQDPIQLDFAQDGDPGGFNVGRADYHFGVTFRASTPGDYRQNVLVDFADTELQIPVTATIVDGAVCDLDVAPTAVDFGLASSQSGPDRLDVWIQNRNLVTGCLVWGFALDPPGPNASDRFSLDGAPTGPTTIAGGDHLLLSLTYAPPAMPDSIDRQTLTFHRIAAAGEDTRVQIPVEGAATRSDLWVTPDPLLLTGSAGTAAHLPVTVTNHGESATVLKIDFRDDSATTLSLGGLPSLPLALDAAAGSLTFDVDLAAAVPGYYRGWLEVWVQGEDLPLVRLVDAPVDRPGP